LQSKYLKLFVYGTLLDPDIQMNIIGRRIKGVKDRLRGYKKIWRQFSCGVYPDLIECDGNEVDGEILDLSISELKKCDQYEGHEYFQLPVKLKSGIQAIAYKGKSM